VIDKRRHCERSEAIHAAAMPALVTRTDLGGFFRDGAALPQRGIASLCSQ